MLYVISGPPPSSRGQSQQFEAQFGSLAHTTLRGQSQQFEAQHPDPPTSARCCL